MYLEREATMMTAAHKMYWSVRDALVTWGLVAKPKFSMQRLPKGTNRRRLTGRGSHRRMRHVSLQRLLKL